jgi:hypothetical protein
MVSEQAQQGFEAILKNSLPASLMHDGDYYEIHKQTASADAGFYRFAVLTISSPNFRILTIFHFGSDHSLTGYFAQNAQSLNQSEIDRLAFDAFLEFCNRCCGAINRDLLNYFPYLGMSTPYVLLEHSAQYISLLNPDYTVHHKIDLGGSVCVGITLCVCSAVDIDFKFDSSSAGHGFGELELF